jgi:uncharacterized protein
MKTKLTFLLSLTFLFLFSGSVYGDDFQDGVDAYERKDYKTAYKLILPLAEKGQPSAQYYLGFMYVNGQGVPPCEPLGNQRNENQITYILYEYK